MVNKATCCLPGFTANLPRLVFSARPVLAILSKQVKSKELAPITGLDYIATSEPC